MSAGQVAYQRQDGESSREADEFPGSCVRKGPGCSDRTGMLVTGL